MTLKKSVFPLSTAGAAIACAFLGACATPTLPGSPSHVTQAPPAAGRIPDPVMHSAPLPPPKATPKAETYSVTVHKVPVQSLLFALARDARLNVDIHPGIEGAVTLNALDQTLPQLLTRIARQIDMRYEIDGTTLTVLPDTPVWRNYKVDYVNMARSTNSSVNIATQISTTGGGSSSPTLTNANGTTSGGAAASGGSGNNNSTTSVTNRSENNFWGSLEKNIRDMLRDTTLNDAPSTISSAAPPAAPGAAAPGAAPANPNQPAPPAPQAVPDTVLAAFNASSNERQRNAPSVIVNAEGGLLAVRATGRQHEKIQQFLDIVLGSAKRQVLIEATIIEVRLSDQYQQGINWSRLHGGLTLTQKPVGSALPASGVAIGSTPGLFSINYLNPTSALGNITTAIQLLESFGKVKVLSSPKISVLNNQTAMLKVVDNNVFFTIKVTPAVIGVNGNVTTPATYESKLETVPVGFVMSVTPQIADSDEVTLNVRPTITRIVGYVTDPNPALAAEKVTSQVPVIQAREVESILKVYSGDISVLGGLMQDSVDNAKDAVPGAGVLPVIGNFFSYRNEKVSKTELVIFIRPVVVKNASVNGDYKDYRYLLPDTTGAGSASSEPYSEPVRVKVN
ncbi:secretin N-terminal domain-containing protein [Massilia antarctica]|uniref:Secretin N-terminal domain-containing protein n=1 Tax=Massilia antarctica TaxID=2765360 RepID=A0AA49A6Z8_9BURK|nr:secretin N-terminal domain-containing protein [Massilia antarctica]QPI48212.1 secretin N-terminal domain-containing protein [Massilia antarctica]